MNHKFKMRQRVTALCMAAMMCCGMLPYGALAEDSARPVVVATPEQAATQEAKSESDANSTATQETADESPDEDAPQQEPETEGDTGGSDELYEIWHKMYPSLTQEPTGYYLDSYGLPVLVGETKISIEGWGNEDYSSVSDDSFQQVALDAALLDADSTTAAFPHMDGEDYAIVPISMQVMYPANGSSADITLPDNVELLGYSFTSGDLTPATEEERQSQLHYEFSEISASVAGIYVKASEDFSVTMTYTDATQTLTKTVHVTLDDSAPVPGILQDRFAQETQVAMCSADEGIATYAGLQVTQCVNTSVGWMNYLGGQPALCGDRGKWAWGPGATYKNKYPPVANYTPAGQVWVEAEYFNKGWVPDQATLWSKGFNNGAPAVASLALDAADNATDNYLALLSWQAEQYPDSIAAEIVNAPEAYAAPTGKTVYVGTLYTPSNAAWQRFVVLNYTPVVLSGDSEIPGFETGGESVDKPWSASYERSESLDFSYTVNTDKIQLDTLEKVDGAGIEIAPILDGIPADIDGGSWTITPDGMQSVTTSGHTADDNYHLNGGDGSVTWTVHFSVSKSASQSGSITANSEQDADAQASAAQSAAQSACEGQVNGEIEAALSAAHNYFDNLKFSYNEVTVPHGFDAFGGDLGSSQTITVPANSSNDYLMPSLHDFYNNLSLQGPQAKALTMALSMYVDGTMDLFAHQTNVDLQNHCICFNTVKLGKSMQSIGMMTVLDQIWNRITRNRVLGRRTWIFTDEFQLLLGNSACTNYYFELSSRARKWGAILTSITQHVRSVLNNEDARRMLSDCGYIKLLNQAPDDANDIARLLHISDEEKRYIENAEVGSGLLIADKVVVPFNNTFPQDTELFRLMDTNPNRKK